MFIFVCVGACGIKFERACACGYARGYLCPLLMCMFVHTRVQVFSGKTHLRGAQERAAFLFHDA